MKIRAFVTGSKPRMHELLRRIILLKKKASSILLNEWLYFLYADSQFRL